MKLNPEDILTVAEAAKLAGCNEQAIYRAERSGDLKRLPIQGNAITFSRREVERWAEAMKQ